MLLGAKPASRPGSPRDTGGRAVSRVGGDAATDRGPAEAEDEDVDAEGGVVATGAALSMAGGVRRSKGPGLELEGARVGRLGFS